MIVDVRLNPGGDNTAYRPLLDVLRSRFVNRPGRLVLLTGRVTFSAAGNFAAEVDARTRARIVGEAAGGSPHNYGDTVEVELETSVGPCTCRRSTSRCWGGPTSGRLSSPTSPCRSAPPITSPGAIPVLAQGDRDSLGTLDRRE